jgi:hypothetical protein
MQEKQAQQNYSVMDYRPAFMWGVPSSLFGMFNQGAALHDANIVHGAQQSALSDAANQEIYKRVGKALAAVGVGGLGLGMSATRLHQMASSMNKPKQKHIKFAPGSHTVDDDEKLASESFGDNAAKTIGGLLLSAAEPATLNPGETSTKMTPSQQSWFYPALLATGGLGIYGGHKLVNSIYEKKRKEDLADEVNTAKKEYQRALTGKRASVLDAAFAKISTLKAAELPAPADAAWATAKLPFKLLEASGLAPAYWTGATGLGLLAGKMTYDWTRERSRDKAIERAQKARARMAGTAPIYVDPEQLAAIKKVVE